MRALFPLLPWILASLIAGSAAADEVRLRDGRVLVGATKKVGDQLHVQCAHGLVVVDLDQVVRIRDEAELIAELERLAREAGQTAFGVSQVATTAHSWGLTQPMWDAIDAALALIPDGSMPPAPLRALLAQLEPDVLPAKWRRASTDVRVRELLYRLRRGATPALAATIEELLVREPDADEALRLRARSANRNQQRLVAVRALARRSMADHGQFLFRTAVVDRADQVRQATARTIRRAGAAADAAAYLAPGLLHDAPAMRIRTAEAYGHMGDVAAVPLLVAAAPFAGTPRDAATAAGATRGHVAFLDQTTYMRDFDVEVAQASFIADPKVDVLQSGMVLDATVHAVTRYRTDIVRSYRRALHHLTGSDPGSDPRRWTLWLYDRSAANPRR